MPSAMGSSNSSSKDNAFRPSRILVVCDATKDRSPHEFRHTIHNIRMQGGIVHPGDTITVFGVLHRILHPMGYQMGVTPDYVLGTTHIRAMEEEVSKRVDMYVGMLQYSAEECEEEGVDIKVKIMAGTPIRKVIVQEVATSDPAWVILDRHLRRESRYYLKHISCKVALVQDNLSLEILRSCCADRETDYVDDKQFHSLSKPVPLPPVSDNENSEQSVTTNSHDGYATSSESSDMAKSSSLSSFTSNSKDYSFSMQDEFGSNPKQGESANYARVDIKRYASPTVMPKQRRKPSRRRSSDVPVLCIACGLKTELDSMRYTYPEIQLATNDFASDNLLGEGGYGFVYKGQLRNGQLIAAKVRKQASTQGFEEFLTEVFVLSFARHKNIVMLLGYCCKENLNILVYEFICNKSLEWHLFVMFSNGTEDMRLPLLGDFGLAKWKTDDDDMQTRILGTLGYLAPEYAENGIVSVRTDVYAFGIVLIQLISGRKAVDTREGQQLSIRQWALPLIETLALHELADPRLGDSYNTYEIYHMARTAYLCVQTDPEMRPSMAEITLKLMEP
ncbi:UNVERIFIED_CONTAM: Inactive protein kinase SELMODRAFT [Sesamum radiatum]|uniref:Inactive protein kinase SELMODRAFT n=1 Tax=Sesamum radiatum TaxID=300843 RepID=A0AAW2M4P9_SESRA